MGILDTIKKIFNKPKVSIGGDDLLAIDEKLDAMLGKRDVMDLIREQLKGITVNFSGEEGPIENDMKENEKKELYANAEILRTNKAFNQIIEYLINVQGNYSMKQAEIMEHVAFGRATINGLTLVKEEVERLSNLHREESKREEEFDKHDLI